MPSMAELAEQIYTHLDNNRPLYPLAEVYANGISPALRLLCILDKSLLTQRVSVTLPAYSFVIDLRTVMPRAHQVLRVVLGDATTEVQTRTVSHFTPLVPTTRERLALLHPAWLKTVRVPSKWFMLGRNLLAIWPRPMTDMVVTLISAVVPTAASVNDQDVAPDIDVAQHPLVADIAAALLMCKEGAGESERAVQMLSTIVGKEPFTAAAKRLREMQAHRPEPQAVGD